MQIYMKSSHYARKRRVTLLVKIHQNNKQDFYKKTLNFLASEMVCYLYKKGEFVELKSAKLAILSVLRFHNVYYVCDESSVPSSTSSH